MDGSITHQDQRITPLNPKTVFVDLLSLHFPDIPGNRHKLTIPDENTAGIIKFYKIGFSAVEHLQDTECRVGYLSHPADGQRLYDRFHTLFQRGTV